MTEPLRITEPAPVEILYLHKIVNCHTTQNVRQTTSKKEHFASQAEEEKESVGD